MTNRKCMLVVLFPILFYLFYSEISSAIEVSGDVSGTWGPEDNPYLVTGNLKVPQQDSLIILPGCQIKFQGHYRFDIDSLAIFKAIGSETDSIIFTNEDTLTGWNGLRFHWADSSCEIAFCRLEWGRGTDYTGDSLALGGAVFCLGNKLTVRNSLFQYNRAWEGYGGAIWAGNSYLIIYDCILDNNFCGWGGSGICAEYSDVVIENNIITNGTTFYRLGGERGGAIRCFYSDVEILNNTITNNIGSMDGGGIFASYSHCLIKDNIVNANQCWYHGAGICVSGAHIINNLIINNVNHYGTASYGGGIACGDSVTLINNTIVNNHCDYFGGGIAFSRSTPADTFENNIVWGNTSYSNSQIDIQNQSPTIIYNDIQGGWPGVGNINSDPLFAGADDFHITWANYPIEDATKSPCIDTGDPASPPDSDGSRADMGAYQFIRSEGIEEILHPNDFNVLSNYPNPFNAQTTISYSLPKASFVSIDIYDLLGRKLESLVNCKQEAGSYNIIWDAKDRSSGVYFYRIQAGELSISRKMLVLK